MPRGGSSILFKLGKAVSLLRVNRVGMEDLSRLDAVESTLLHARGGCQREAQP